MGEMGKWWNYWGADYVPSTRWCCFDDIWKFLEQKFRAANGKDVGSIVFTRLRAQSVVARRKEQESGHDARRGKGDVSDFGKYARRETRKADFSMELAVRGRCHIRRSLRILNGDLSRKRTSPTW